MTNRAQRRAQKKGEIVNAEGVRVELKGALEGHHIVVDVESLTLGFIEDLESEKVGLFLEALPTIIISSDLPHGHDKAGLRALNARALLPLVEGIAEAMQIPKAL